MLLRNNRQSSARADEAARMNDDQTHDPPASPLTPNKPNTTSESLLDATAGHCTGLDNRKAKKNLTRMVIIMSILFFVGNLPHTIALMLLPLINQTKSNLTFLVFFVIFSNSMLFASHGSCIFVYYFFNRHFRNLLNCKTRKFFGLSQKAQ